MTWEQLVASATKEFQEAGIEDARTNAEYLAAHVSRDSSRAEWRLKRRASVKDDAVTALMALVQRRLQREPLQYILGEWEFFGLPMVVRPGVLIPRPETEVLVEEALREASNMPGPITIVDAGTGSGAIALALASRLPNANVLAYDISEDALMIARENQNNLKIQNVTFERNDILDVNWLADYQGNVDLLVSNPPYVSLKDFDMLDPELRLFEPRQALTDEANGLTFYDALVRYAKRLLSPNGRLLVELGYDVCEGVIQIVNNHGLQVLRVVKDLAGIDRVLVAEWEGSRQTSNKL
jgi:release factor glutamine methyltransferase